MGERVNGIHEVRGSIPLASTRFAGREQRCGRHWENGCGGRRCALQSASAMRE